VAEAWHRNDPEPPGAAIREAATIVLVRDGERGVEVLMLLRSPAVEFSPGAYVFPGGGLDVSDRDPESERLCVGRTDREASAALGLHAGGLAFWLAAVRECFEEAGVLLANDRAGRPVSFADTSTAARYHSYRHRMNAGELTLLDLCRTEGLTIDVGAIHYLAHWLTPRGAPRRYDTRFLLAAAPAEQEPLHDDGEAVASLWITPREALNRNAAGDYELIRPTLETLEALGRFRSCTELLEAIALMDRLPESQPRMGARGEGVRVLLPGDGGWDAAAQEAGQQRGRGAAHA
jgi:8-oxo-dGTP pyrophosphatase MutT (NUDIX family)